MRYARRAVALAIGIVFSAAAVVVAETGAASASVSTHVQEIEQWRTERDQRLRQPDGWFSLVGLAWLEEGESTCGSDPSSDVRFPASLPARLGVLARSEDGVDFVAAEGVEVSIDGETHRRARLATDAGGEPTLVDVGTVRFHLLDRGGRIGVRIKDSQSAALLAYQGMENYPIDERWRVEGKLVPYEPPKSIAVPSVLGTTNETPSPGAVEWRMAGQVHRLDVLPGGEGQYFVLFSDATNGKETYGAGRFLYTAVADPQGRVVLDFNKAYNPPCAFTPYATCPLPPRQNRLELAVRAGEKKYTGAYAH
ncbi:MAG: DUF1684 domain-containing protein [Acidobacteriota bacterium]